MADVPQKMVGEIGRIAAAVQHPHNVGDDFGVFRRDGSIDVADQRVSIETDGHFLIVVQHGVELSGIVGPHGEVLLQPGLERFETVHPQKAAKP